MSINARPPRLASATLRMLPARLIMVYLVTTLCLFAFWPINWPIYENSEWLKLISYLMLCFTLLYSFFAYGSLGRAAKTNFSHHKRTIIAGAVAAVILLFPSGYYYAGRWPWQVMEALRDQGEAYRGLQDTLVETAGQRTPIALLRGLFAPLVFAVVPLGILHWRTLNWATRGAVAAAALSSIVFSILRGTDREFADLFIVSGSAVLISLVRRAVETGRGFGVVKKYWKHAIGIFLFLFIASNMFADRKEARLGGIGSVCAVGTGICVDLGDPKISWMGDRTLFSVSIFTMSVSQGYYGLWLGMQQSFQSSWGLGHSASLTALYENITGDKSLTERTYTTRNALLGWPPEYFWSTGIIWFANDIGFYGVLPLLAAIGFLWGRVWRDATQAGNDPAAVLFCLLVVLTIYLPANNQIFNSFDGYFILAFWLVSYFRSLVSVRHRIRPK